MSGEHDRRSSRDVANEAEDTRAHLANTLEQLRTNLRPENVVDEVMSNARAGAASVADGLAGVAKANPIPSLLIAAGAFVVMGVMSRAGLQRNKPATHPGSLPRAAMLHDPESFPAAAETDVAATAARLDPAAPSWDADPERAGSRSRLTAGLDGLKRGASSAYDTTSSSARDAVQSLSHYVPRDRRDVKSKLSNLLDDQPLILGAIGLAVGAAIGAALPTTATEDSLMGGTSHQVRQAATDVARHEVDGLRAVAGEVVGNIKKSAVDHGLSTDNLNDLVKDVGAEARAGVSKVGSAHDV